MGERVPKPMIVAAVDAKAMEWVAAPVSPVPTRLGTTPKPTSTAVVYVRRPALMGGRVPKPPIVAATDANSMGRVEAPAFLVMMVCAMMPKPTSTAVAYVTRPALMGERVPKPMIAAASDAK